MLIEPAVRLTEEVLQAVNRTRTVVKVVMTSSIGVRIQQRLRMPEASSSATCVDKNQRSFQPAVASAAAEASKL